MSRHPTRHGLVAGLVALVAALAGPVAPASAAPSTITVLNMTAQPMTKTNLSIGDVVTIHVCFQNTVARSGGGDADVKLVLNARAAGVAWGGTLATAAGLPANTNNCLVFTYTVASGDTSVPVNTGGLKATAITLSNSATLTISTFDTLNAPSNALTPEQMICNTNLCGGGSTPLSVDVTAPTATLTPADNAVGQPAGTNLVLNFSEQVFPSIAATRRECTGGNTATITTESNHGLAVGDVIYVSQVGPTYDSSSGTSTYFRVSAVPTSRKISYARSCTTESETNTGGAILPVRYVTVAEDASADKTLSFIAVASQVATITTSAAHGFEVGDVVVIEGAATGEGGATPQPNFNGAFVVLTTGSNTTFTVNLTHIAAGSSSLASNVGDLGSTAAVGTVRRVIEAIPSFTPGKVTLAGSPTVATINPAFTLAGGTAVHARVQLGAFRDSTGNVYAGITTSPPTAGGWNFGTAAGDAVINNITSSTADGYYRNGGGTNPSIQVLFNQSVEVTGGTPRLVLNAGDGAVATYASGSPGKTLTFTYTIGAGHSTLLQPGQRLNVTGLQLNGGTMSGGVTDAIVVPATGTSGSLNNNKNIVIDNTAPVPSQFQPFPNAIGVQATSPLTVIFPENMAAVATKKLYIKTLVAHTPATISTAALASNVVTITTAAAHGLAVGNTVVIALNPASAVYDGTFTVASVPTTTTFTYAKENANVASASKDGTATRTVWETITIVTAGGGANTAVTNFVNNGGAAVTVTRAAQASTVNLITDPATSYYVEAEAGAFADLAGNTSAAITGSGTWYFQASPDVTAPTFNPAQSSPSHNFNAFPPTGNITLTFSEAVSTVAAKTITLCTGSADCATPVETFTLPSARVTSLGGGQQFQIDPTANLLVSTTYFLLIDAGAFVDGANNPTAAATTAGQYQFTTSGAGSSGGAPANSGGGGGGTSSCGPPPLPPCGVSAGLNFGPGGTIQNPGSIGGSDMANLRADNFIGFSPSAAGNLSAGAMQNFRSDQFAALPASAMAGFSAAQMSQMSAGAMAGFSAAQMGQMSAGAMAGFNATQMGQLPPAAMAGFNATQMGQLPASAMGGFDATKMAALTMTAMAGFNSDQFAQLPPSSMTAFDSTRMAALPSTAVAGFNASQMGQLPPEAMRVFDPSKMQQLPPAAMAGFDPTKMQALPTQAMAVMNPNQLGQMPPAAFGAILTQQFNVLPPTAMQGFKAELMAALPPQMVQNFKPEQFAALPPASMGGLNEDRFRALPPQAMTAFNPQQMGAVPPQAMEGMRVAQFNVIPPTAMQGFKPDQFAALPPDAMQSFKPAQMAALPAQALAGMEPGQIRVLPPTAARALNPQQVGALPPQAMAAIPPGVFKAFSAASIAALTPEQRNALPPEALNPPPLAQPATAGNISGLINSLSGWNIDKVPPAAFTGMKPTDVAKLPADAFTALSPNQFTALPPAAFTGLKPNQVELLPPEAMAAMKPTQLGQLSPTAFAAFSPAQVGALPPAALAGMKPTQTGQLPSEAFEVMKSTQVAALPPAAVGGLKPEQMAALPPEAMTTMKPTQVGALKPTTMAALEPAQIAALPPTALTQMKPTQAAALALDAIAELKPTQVAALPPAAVGGLKPEQVSALEPEAMTTMTPAQVGALKPTAMAALEPAQVDALPPTALRQVDAKQLGAIPPDAMKSLDTAQINALPTEAFKGMKPEQANALSPDQARAMSPQDVQQMSPAVKSIVNGLKAQPPTGA